MIIVSWEFFLDRGVAPLRGTIEFDDDATDDQISEIVEDEVRDKTLSRITWERATVTK